jgi:hypothetical protein
MYETVDAGEIIARDNIAVVEAYLFCPWNSLEHPPLIWVT